MVFEMVVGFVFGIVWKLVLPVPVDVVSAAIGLTRSYLPLCCSFGPSAPIASEYSV